MADQQTIELLIDIKGKLDTLPSIIQGLKQTGDVGANAAKRIQEGFAESETNFTKLASFIADLTISLKGVQEGATFLKELASAAFEAVREISAQDVALTNLSKASGASKETIAALQNEFVKLGESSESVRGGISQFGGFIADALANPLSDAGKNAKLLGINLDLVRGSLNPFDTALKQVAQTTNGATTSVEQFKAATLAFGEDDAPKVIASLKDLDDKIGKVKARGAILSPEQSKQAQDLFASLGDVNQELQGISKQILAELLPSTNRILQLAKEGIEGLDEDSIQGLKSGISEIGRTLEAIAPVIINTSQFLLEFAGNFGTAISAILNPFETLNFLITGNSTSTEKAAVSQQKLVTGFQQAKFAAEVLSKQIQQLTSDQDLLTKQSEINAEKETLLIKARLRQGLIDETEAASAINKIEEKKAKDKEDREFEKFSIVKASLNKELNARNEAAKNEETNLANIQAKKKAAVLDLENFLKESKARIARLQGEFESANISADELKAAKEKDAQILDNKRTTLNTINELEQQSIAKKNALQSSASEFNKAINTKELLDVTKTKDDILAARATLNAQTAAFEQAKLDRVRATNKAIADSEEAILGRATTRIKETEKNEQLLTEDLQKQLNARLISEQQFNSTLTGYQIAANQERLIAQETALNELNAKRLKGEQVSQQAIRDLEKSTSELRTQILEESRQKRIQDLQNDLANTKTELEAEQTLYQAFFQGRQNQINQIKDATKQQQEQQRLEIDIAQRIAIDSLKQIDLEEKNLELLRAQGATKEELEKQENKIVLAIENEIAARNAAIAKEKQAKQDQIDKQAQATDFYKENIKQVETLGARTNSVVGALDTMVGKISSVTQAFDATKATVEDIRKEIENLRADGQDLLLNSQAVVEGRIEAALSFYDTANELERKLALRIIEEQRQAQIKAGEERAKLLQEEATKAIEIETRAQDEIAKAKAQRRQENKKLKEDEQKENADFNQAELDAKKKLGEDETRITEEFNKRENQIAEQAKEAALERIEELKQAKINAALDEADKLNSIQRQNLAEQAKLQQQIDAEKDPKKKAQLQDQLLGITKQGQEKEKTEKEKQAELDKALAASANNEEFQARKAAIEKKYQLLEDEQAQRAEIEKTGNKEALARFDQLVAEQKKRDEQRLADELARIKAQQEKKAKQAEDERNQRKADYEKQLEDLKKSFDTEETARQTAHDTALKNLKARQQEIKDQYKDTVNKVMQDEITALNEVAKAVGLSGVAFSKSFDDNVAKVAKLNDELKKVLGNLAAIGGDSGGSSSSSTSSSSSSSSTTNSASNNNPFGGGSPSSGNPSGLGNPFGATTRPGANNSPPTNPPSSTSQNNSVNPNQKQSSKPNLSLDSSANNAKPGGSNPDQNTIPTSPGGKIRVPDEIKTGDQYRAISVGLHDEYFGLPQDSRSNLPLIENYGSKLQTALTNYIATNGLTGYLPEANYPPVLFQVLSPRSSDKKVKEKLSDNRSAFTAQVNHIIARVNTVKKDQDKEDTPPPKQPKDTPGSDGSSIGGKTAGDVGRPEFGIKIENKPGSLAPGDVGKKSGATDVFNRGQDVLKRRQADLSVGKDESETSDVAFLKGLSADSAVGGSGSAASAVGNPNANLTPEQAIGSIQGTTTANIGTGLVANVSVNQITPQDKIGQAVEEEIMKLLQSGQLDRTITGKVNDQNKQQNFNRNPTNNVIT